MAEQEAQKIHLHSLLPKGIRVRKGAKSVSLIVQTRKQVTDNGKKKIIPDCRTVKLDLPNKWNSAEYETAFLEALEEAKKEKVLALKHIAIHGVDTPNVAKRTGAVATLSEVYDGTFEKQWKGKPQEKHVGILANDVFAFFPKSTNMHEMQTWDNYENFIEFCRKRVFERKMNNLGTCTTNTINRRLGIIRCCIAHAIKYGLMNRDKVLNPDPREASNYGWKNLPLAKLKDKHTLSIAEEQEVYAKAKELGDDEFADAFYWLIDVGMRYETEFRTFTIKDINWKRGTICFWREKTKEWSIDLPLSKRAMEIAKRYKDLALTRKSQRMFEISKHKTEAMFKKYRAETNIEDFTPYITRTTFGTRLGERHIHPTVISRMMGHACVETSQRYYVKPTAKGYERAMKIKELSDDEFDNYLHNQNNMIGHNSR